MDDKTAVPKNIEKKIHLGILYKLCIIFITIFLVPILFFVYLGKETSESISTIKNSSIKTVETTENSFNQTILNLESILKIQAISRTGSLVNLIELLFKIQKDKLLTPEDIDNNENIRKLIIHEKINSSGYICIID